MDPVLLAHGLHLLQEGVAGDHRGGGDRGVLVLALHVEADAFHDALPAFEIMVVKLLRGELVLVDGGRFASQLGKEKLIGLVVHHRLVGIEVDLGVGVEDGRLEAHEGIGEEGDELRGHLKNGGIVVFLRVADAELF